MSGPRFSRIDMDSVAPLLPHDKTAAVVGGKGVHYEFQPNPTQVHSKVPLPTRTATPRDTGRPTFINADGAQIGRLRVIGISAASDEQIRWVVRCVCGTYEIRRTKYIRQCLAGENPGQEEPMCSWCGNTRRLQRGHGKKAEEQKWRSVLGEDFNL